MNQDENTRTSHDIATARVSAQFGIPARSTQLTLLLTGSLGPMVGAAIAPALPFMRAHFAAEANADFLVRLLLTMPALAIALVAPFAGYIIDRSSKQRVLLVAVVAYVIFGAGGLFLDNLHFLLFSRAALGVAVAFVMCSVTALVADLFEPLSRAGFFGRINSTNSITGMLFVLCGGMLADLSWRASFLVYVCTAPLLILLWRYVPRHSARPIDENPTAGGEGGHMHWAQVGVMYAFAICCSIFFYLVLTQSPFLITGLRGGSATLSGVAIGLFTIAGFPFSFSYGRIRKRLSPWTIFAIGFAATGTGFMLQAFAASMVWIIVAMAVTGTGFGLLVPNVSATILSSIPARVRGRAAGAVVSCFFLGQFLSPIFSQPLVTRYGLSHTFLIAGATLLLGSALLVVIYHAHRSTTAKEGSTLRVRPGA
jgi:MFS family permease